MNPTGGPFAEADSPSPLDLTAAASARTDAATRVSDALTAHPRLVADPAGTKAVLSQPNADGYITGNAAKFMSAYGATHQSIKAVPNSPNPHAQGWLGGLWHSVASMWDGVRHATAGIPRAVSHIPGDVGGAFMGVPSAAEGMGKAAWHDATVGIPHYINESMAQNAEAVQSRGVIGGQAQIDQPYIQAGKDLGVATVRGVKRAAITATEVGSLGQVGPEGIGNVGGNLSDASTTVVNALNQTVNPFTVYRNMAHTIAFTESLARRKGVGYALETMLPYLAAAMVTHTALVGVGGEMAAGEVDRLTTQITSEGGTLSPEEQALAREAQTVGRLGVPEAAPAEPGVANVRVPFEHPTGEMPSEPPVEPPVESPAQRSMPFRAASRIVGTITKPLSAATKVAHTIGAPMSDVRLNAMYALAKAGMNNDPSLKPLWDLTSNGVPVDENNQPIHGGVGGEIAQYLGLPQGAWSSFIGGGINVYANYLGADPLGAAGKVIGATRTFNSVGGIVGHFFSGLGIRAPEDVSRAAAQYVRVRRAFQWMADHTAGQINETFGRMFIGESGREVLDLLGKATTSEEVQKIFADMSQGIGYVHNTVPTMSLYQFTKAYFKYDGVSHAVDEALAGSDAQLHAEASDIHNATGETVWPPDSANYAVATGNVGAAMRARTIAANAFAKLFTNRESYFNEPTSKMENSVMDIGSTDLPNAIGNQLRALGEDRATIAMVQDQLLHATPDEYNQFVVNSYYNTIMKLTFANAKYSVLDQVKVQIGNDLREQLLKMMGPDGAGEKGVMVNHPLGPDFSTVVRDGVEKNAGIGETHLGQLHFPRTRDLKGYAKFVSREVENFTRAQDGMMGVDSHLSEEALQAKASFADSTLSGLAGRLDAKIGAEDTRFAHELGGTMGTAYDAKMTEISQEVKSALSGVSEGDTLGHNRAFVAMFERVRQNLDVTQRIVNLVDEWQFNSKFLGHNDFERQLQLEELNAKLPPDVFTSVESATPEAMAKLRGELSALQDASAEMTARLQKNAITLDDLKLRVGERDATLSPEQKDALAQRIQNLRERNPRYRNGWQSFIDGVNYYQTKIFVPLALYSGGWAVRVGTNELVSNAFREGGMNFFQNKLLTSYIKHETGRAAFSSKMEGLLARHLSKRLFAGSMGKMLARTDLNFGEKVLSATLRTAGGAILGMRDIAGGTLHGLEGNLINWTPRTERMFDRVVGAVNEYAPGGLPMGVHSSGGIMADQAVRDHLLFGEDEGGKSIASTVNRNRTFAGVNPGDRNYYRGMRGSLTRISDDQYLNPAMLELNRQLPSIPQYIDQTRVDQLLGDMTNVSLTKIESMPEKELARFERHFAKGKMAIPDEAVFSSLSPEEQLRVAAMTPEARATFYNHYDWARTIAHHDLYTVMGTAGEGRFIIHPELVRQAATGEVKSLTDIRSFIDKLPERTEPRNIVAEVTAHESATGIRNRLASAMNMPQEITSAGFHSVLGPVVNAYVRDPVYLGVYDDEMEKLQSMVDQNLITEETQKARAHENAVVKMTKFVHNPQERNLLESNMRAFAPFYFAQNQAWRRVLRVASEDPGAFEKYLRLSLAFTNFVSVHGQNGAAPVYIPGTQFMGAIGGLGSGLAPNQLGSLGFSLAASVGSTSSIIPTGSEAGLGVLENIVRPSWGPLVTTTLKEAEHYLGLSNIPWANKTIQAILGPIASNSSLESELLPSTFFRNALNTAEGFLHIENSSFASAQIYVLNNAVDNLSTSYYDKAYSTLTTSGVPAVVASHLARALSEKQVADFLNVSTNYRAVHAFMDQVHMAAVFMYMVKSALGMASPVALSLQQSFSKDPQFQKLLNAKKPNGQPRYTFEEASLKFANEFPNHIYDVVSHSKPEGSNYAETTSALNLIQNYPYVVSTYRNAAAYLINRDGTYSPQAYQLELAQGMRSRYSLEGGDSGLGGYFDALMIANGNDYYYNWLKPMYPDSPGSKGYTNYKELTAKAKQYGLFDNPTWFGNFSSGGGRWASEAAAVDQMSQMLTDPNVPDAVYGGKDGKLMYQVALSLYDGTVTKYMAAQTSSERYAIESHWYDTMTKLSSDTQAVSPALSYFITSVLRNLPTAKK